MLLKVGFTMMALALCGVVVAVVLTQEPARSAAVKSAQEDPTEPLQRTDPGIEPWREDAVDPTPIEKTEPDEPEPVTNRATAEPEPSREPQAEPDPAPDQEPSVPRVEPEPKPEPELEPEPEVEEPPEPTEEQIASAHEPRHYRLPDGAALGLTVDAIGIHDAPVFDSVGAWALKHGVGHHPETSMPWSGTPQRNVYLAGHRLGFPGTASHLIFYRLDELGRGDEVLLKDRDGGKYRYRVTEAFKADPGDSWVMGQVRGRDLVTLQTCTGPNWERRLIVRAERM